MYSTKAGVCHVPYLVDHTGALSRGEKPHVMAQAVNFEPVSVLIAKAELDRIFTGPNVVTSHEFTGNARSKANYLRTHFALVDFDNGTTPETVIDRLAKINPNLLYYINFSANNQPQTPKFHLVLFFTRPVEGEEEFDVLLSWLLDVLGDLDPDLSVIKDRARAVIRGNGAFPTMFGGSVPIDIDQMMNDHHVRQTAKRASTVTADNRGTSFRLEFNQSVQLDNDKGPWSRFNKLNPADKRRVLCPVCGHRHDLRGPAGGQFAHNATYCLSEVGLPIVFCSSCKARGWGSGGAGVYNFVVSDQHAWLEKVGAFRIVRDLGENRFKLIRQDKREGGFSVDTIDMKGIDNWYAERGVQAPEHFLNVDFVFDFTSDKFMDVDARTINTYQAPYVLRTPIPLAPVALPSMIGHLIRHIAGDDNECVERFLDWLAVIVQQRRKLPTAWLFQGTQGTGKGMFFNQVLSPIFGLNHCMLKDMKTLVSNFNGDIEDKVLVAMDEVQADFTDLDANVIEGRLKSLIGEDWVRLEKKYVDARKSRIYTNFLFFSNKFNAIKLEDGDRRFNVCPRQEGKLIDCAWLPGRDPNQLVPMLHAEHQDFVHFLRQRKVDVVKVLRVLDNQPKRDLMEATLTTTEIFFQKVRELDWDWFREHLNHRDFQRRPDAEQAFNVVFQRDSNPEARKYITTDEICSLFNNIIHDGPADLSKARIARKPKQFGVDIRPIKLPTGESVRGYRP